MLILLPALSGWGQGIRDFSQDTALFVSELRTFTGVFLETTEVPDFERFVRLYDSLPHDQRMEIIEVSNLMLDRRCRPRPHFIAYQRVMLTFFSEDRVSLGYHEWIGGYIKFLQDNDAQLKDISQWLTITLSLLEENIIYQSNSIIWKVSTPSFQFHSDEELSVRFEDVTIACYSGRDYIQVMHATGYINPFTLEWFGTEGKVTWERSGMPESEMYALLGDFKINLKTPAYTADSVELYYPALFEGTALGRMEDKVSLIKNLADIKYPQFVSYQSSYRIDDFVPGIHYMGGLSIEGANLVGSAVGGDPAVFEIYSNDTLRIRTQTERVSMNSRFIRSQHAAVTIYFGDDSIYHPDLALSFDIGRDQLRLNKTEDFKSQGPYSNSYHNIDMNFDELSWTRGESIIKLQALQGSAIGRASFESNTYFDFGFFMDLQGMDYEHPLAQLYTYSNMLGGRTFHLVNYANYVGYAEYQVRHLIMGLSKFGFLYYNDKENLITVRQKLFDYISASMKQRDYDVIRFISRTEGVSNAELDLDTKDLTITGIPVIFLSDSQNVKLIPKGSSIVMKRNRGFQFDGIVDAGLFKFTGHNFYFDYDSFKINLQNIDSLQLSVKSGEYNQYGEPILEMIDNAFEQMTGQLLIDDPQNKSGLQNYPQYPHFASTEGAYIFFDHPEIQNGVYKRENFYFQMDPFTIDSLDNYNPRSLAPSGTFTSAGVLPPMAIDMTLREDNSLGFYMSSPEEGIPVYGGLGTFYNDIEMSNSGLRGSGSFDYLTSTTWSDEFMMHPDSMMALSRRFLIRENEEGTEFPYVENTEAKVKLFPEEDQLIASKMDETFHIFNDSIFHGGNLALSSSGLTGDGPMGFPDARIVSDSYHYGVRTVRADSAGVQIKKQSMDDYTFLTSDVSAYIDLDEHKGEFTARGDATLIELPYNLYETRLDRVTWMMDSDEVLLSQSKELPENTVDIGIDSLRTNGPHYLSTHPGQDSLEFVATEATYNYRTRKLYATGVPFIEVADAYIFPHERELEVGYQATMNLLENARVIANQQHRKHLLYDASITIKGARDYSGMGSYDYRDAFGNSYKLFFERIWVDTTLQSRSKGIVEPEDPFMLSPYFDFQGDVSLAASDDLLSFDGGTRLVHDCNIRKDWLRFTSVIDPTTIQIPVPEQMQNTALNKIFAGTMITRDSTHIYSAFVSGRKDYFDAAITTASGLLLYNPELESYVISTPEKIADPAWPGRYLRLETENCLMYAEGPIDLTVDYGLVKIVAAGNATHRVEEDAFETHLVMGLDFLFSPEALQVMGSEIDSLPDLEPVDLSSAHYQLAMKDLLGRDLANRLEQQLGLTGAYEEIPPQLKHTIFFNDLNLQWNQDTRSFRYNGKIGIGNIGDIQVNKKVDAYIELVEKGSGDIFDIYLRVDDRTWYYIAYTPGGLQVLSSNRLFNEIVFDLKAGDRRIKGKPGRPSYIYSLAARRRLDLFMERFLDYEE